MIGEHEIALIFLIDLRKHELNDHILATHVHQHELKHSGASLAIPLGLVALFTIKGVLCCVLPQNWVCGPQILTLAALSELQLRLFFWGDFYGQNLRN